MMMVLLLLGQGELLQNNNFVTVKHTHVGSVVGVECAAFKACCRLNTFAFLSFLYTFALVVRAYITHEHNHVLPLFPP